MDKTVENAIKLASDNYSEWGQWVIECMSKKEIEDDLAEFDTLEDWVYIKKTVGSVYRDIENTAW